MEKTYYLIKGQLNVRPENLWAVLLDKVTNPQKYVPSARNVTFDKIDDRNTLRTMHRGATVVTEFITIDQDKKETIFKLRDHINYEGTITSRVENLNSMDPNSCYLVYELDWEVKPGREEDTEIFNWLSQNCKLSQKEMLKTFNCGIGMILIIKRKDLEKFSTFSKKIK